MPLKVYKIICDKLEHEWVRVVNRLLENHNVLDRFSLMLAHILKSIIFLASRFLIFRAQFARYEC